MNKKMLLQTLLSVLAFIFLFGCAAKEPAGFSSFTPQKFDLNQYASKVDNFLVIIDASSSMRHDYNGNVKFSTAKTIAQRLNMTVPELNQTAGLRSFGHHPSVSRDKTSLFYGMEPYATAGLAQGLEKITQPGGTSPLGPALNAAQTDFEGLSGIHNAVVIISDGKDMTNVLNEARALKNKFGSSLCIYPVLVGDAPEGRKLLQDVSDIGACGFFTTADDIMTSAGMAGFVEKVFLTAKPAPAPAPAPEPERKDSDGDGVYDDQDQCPGTPAGARVNAVGCWVLDNVLFDFDKAVIKPEAYPLLDEVVKIMEKNPAMSVELQGHTDNIGTKEYNMDLSSRRSNAVAKYLVEKGILRNRLATTAFGFSKPVALNGTEFGRSLNRRVELHPY
ncbi:MAG: OmpA family protein [Desulfotignum sp.]|nr:OmpA family protein [Desulfotignum sp.]MCF8124879.1 OmpA family protein [Desulfotignum sp.]